jgi:Ca2+-binding RTX toxin-like protein
VYSLSILKLVRGGPGNDGVVGGNGADNLVGGLGNDAIYGAVGPDKILGGAGNDYMIDGERKEGATDTLVGGTGTDVIDPFNEPASRDIVSCGAGFDRVLVDGKDVFAPDCEKVAIGLAEVKRLDQQIAKSGFYDKLFRGLPLSPVNLS